MIESQLNRKKQRITYALFLSLLVCFVFIPALQANPFKLGAIPVKTGKSDKAKSVKETQPTKPPFILYSYPQMCIKSDADRPLRLDSMITTGLSKRNPSWVNMYKEKYSYDGQRNLTQNTRYKWDKDSNSWRPSSMYRTTYDNNGLQTVEYAFVWRNQNKWEFDDKRESFYNEKGLKIREARTRWNAKTQDWNAALVSKFTYDSEGNLIQRSNGTFLNNTGEYFENWKAEYHYNYRGNKVLDKVYNFKDGSWKHNYKTEYNYNVDLDSMVKLDYRLNESSGRMSSSEKTSYRYNDHGDLEQTLVQKRIGNQWNNYRKYNNIYDNDGNLIKEVNYKGQGQSTNWEGYLRKQYYYSRFTYIGQAGVKLHPIPITHSLTVELPTAGDEVTFKLFDLLGHQLISQTLTATNELNMEDIISGVYLYRIYTRWEWHTGYLVKEQVGKPLDIPQ